MKVKVKSMLMTNMGMELINNNLEIAADPRTFSVDPFFFLRLLPVFRPLLSLSCQRRKTDAVSTVAGLKFEREEVL